MQNKAGLRVAVIGSRDITELDLSKYLPAETREIVSGGARGIDSIAAAYAKGQGLLLKEFLPAYDIFGKTAPLMRNRSIAKYCDVMYAFWDGRSSGTQHAISCTVQLGKPVYCVRIDLAQPAFMPPPQDLLQYPMEDFF